MTFPLPLLHLLLLLTMQQTRPKLWNSPQRGDAAVSASTTATSTSVTKCASVLSPSLQPHSHLKRPMRCCSSFMHQILSDFPTCLSPLSHPATPSYPAVTSFLPFPSPVLPCPHAHLTSHFPNQPRKYIYQPISTHTDYLWLSFQAIWNQDWIPSFATTLCLILTCSPVTPHLDLFVRTVSSFSSTLTCTCQPVSLRVFTSSLNPQTVPVCLSCPRLMI